MTTLAELQKRIAAHITEMPPDIQSKVLDVAAVAYKAGYLACQQEMQQASKSLTVH